MDTIMTTGSELETEGTSLTDDELQLISNRAAEIQREFRSEMKSLEERRRKPAPNSKTRRLTNQTQSPAASFDTDLDGSVPKLKMDSIQSDLNHLSRLLASKLEAAHNSSRPKSSQSKTSTQLSKKIETEAEPITALDEAIQSSLNRIKRNVRLNTEEDNSESSSVFREVSEPRTPVNSEPYKAQFPSIKMQPMLDAIKKEAADITNDIEHENFKRRVNLLKYELEAEQKSSTAKITVLTEELKTCKELIDSASQRNFELEEELKALNERLEVEIAKNFELSKTLKSKVAYLVSEIENFRAFEKDLEQKLKAKENMIEELDEENKEKSEQLENLKEAYAKQLKQLKDDLHEARSSYEKNLNNIQEQNSVEKDNMIQTMNKKLEVTTREFKKKLSEEKLQHEEEIDALRAKLKEREEEHEKDLRKQRSDFDEQLESRLNQERSLAESDKEEALRRQQMRLDDELTTVKKRLNDELDAEKRRCLEAERCIESLRQELNSAKDDIQSLQKESVEAIKETQRACDAANEMRLSQLRDEMNEEKMNEEEKHRSEYQAMLKDKQTADLDTERLTNKIADLEKSRVKEQRRILVKINKAIAEMSTSIGIQPRQVFVGPTPIPAGAADLSDGTQDDSVIGGSQGRLMNFDLLLKSGLDNLSATADEVGKYSREHEFKIQKLREQFATYQAQRDIEVSDMRFHLENETDRMIEFAKERLHQKYIRDLDELRNEIRRDNDIESALRKTVDRQHSALQSLMKCKQTTKRGSGNESVNSTDTAERNRRNIQRLQGLNSKVTTLNQIKK